MNVGMIDERGELAAMYKGIAQNDVGMRTDVLSNVPKGVGMKMLIRSMAPKIIVADEIGSYEDVEAINQAVCSRHKRNVHSPRQFNRGHDAKSSIEGTIENAYIRKNRVSKHKTRKRRN